MFFDVGHFRILMDNYCSCSLICYFKNKFYLIICNKYLKIKHIHALMIVNFFCNEKNKIDFMLFFKSSVYILFWMQITGYLRLPFKKKKKMPLIESQIKFRILFCSPTNFGINELQSVSGLPTKFRL